MKTVKKAIAFGKLILFGEHSAVYGFPACGTTLPYSMEIKICNTTKKRKNKLNPDDYAIVSELIDTAFKVTGNTNNLLPDSSGFSVIDITSNIPVSSGFGSSAALCVSVARLVLNKPAAVYSKDVHELANILEKNFHGTPSGIDTGMSCGSGITAWFFSDGPGILPEMKTLNLKEKIYLLYGALPRRKSAYSSIAEIRKKKRKNLISELGTISKEFILHAENPDPEKYAKKTGILAREAQKILKTMDLSVPELDYILETAGNLGATGGKLSGAGMGGAFYICAENKDNRNYLLNRLTEKIKEKNIKLTLSLTSLDIE